MKTIKRGMLIISVILCFVLLPKMTVSAKETASGKCGANASWTLSDTGVLTISGTGDITSHQWTEKYNKAIKKVVISKGITNIPEKAFRLCTSLSSITIPNSVTSIGDYAFEYCWHLSSITIPNSVKSIGNYAFNCCEDLTSIKIPNSVTRIGRGAFYCCSGLTSAVMPNSITYISVYAFCYCTKLSKIVIPNSVTSIADYAFYDCESLTSIAIPNSVTYIGQCAFEYCGLTNITFPNSITDIENCAFADCRKLESITIPNSVTSICSTSFIGCSNLNSIKVDIGNTKYDSRDNCNAIIETDTNVLVLGCKNTNIPTTVTAIGNSAFNGREKLTNITIPNSVTSIGTHVFYDCESLTSIVIPNSVTSIGQRAFVSCKNLTSIAIPNSVTSIGKEVFENSDKVIIYSHNELIHNYAKENNIQYKDEHVLEKTEAVSATTSSAGNIEYYTCILCGKFFSDSSATNEIAENSWVIEPIIVSIPDNPTANKGDNPATNNDTSPVADDGTVIAGIHSVSLNKEYFTYNGKAIKAKVSIFDIYGNIVSSDNYDLTYSKSLKNVGTKSVTITFKGSYSGIKTLKYNVIPKNVSKIKVKKGSKAITVSWKKQSKQTSGYQIEYSTKKNFKNAKRITVKNTKKTKTSIKSIKAGKKYYVRIRTYKKVGSKKYYSTWSKVKVVK